MAVIAFPTQTLTSDDEAAIVAQVQREDHYRCQREVDTAGRSVIALLNRERQQRGRVSRRHGIYTVQDARGHVVLRTRRLDELLDALVM